MHEEDCKLLLLNENDNKKVFYLDLEKGKVISELVLFSKISLFFTKNSNRIKRTASWTSVLSPSTQTSLKTLYF